jgi:hypothetical protein
LGLFPLMLLDGDDLRHPLGRDLPGCGGDRGDVVAAREHRAEVIGGDQGIPQRHVDPLPSIGRHRACRVPWRSRTTAGPDTMSKDSKVRRTRDGNPHEA